MVKRILGKIGYSDNRERQSIRERRRLGTQSLQIPLLEQGMMGSGNLRY